MVWLVKFASRAFVFYLVIAVGAPAGFKPFFEGRPSWVSAIVAILTILGCIYTFSDIRQKR